VSSEIDLDAAATRLNGVVKQTPVLRSRLLDERVGAEVHLKAENLQTTGAFKFRGAFNAIAALDADVRERGIISFSSGNHAQAVARAAQIFNVPATIVMPHDAPTSKRSATEAYGAEIISYDRYTESREDVAAAIRDERTLTLIPPFDHLEVIAGQSTCVQEFFNQSGSMDQLVISVGGGGLISGSALAAHRQNPDCQIVGVEPVAGNDVQLSLQQDQIVHIEVPETIADGQQTTSPGIHTFEIMRRHVARIATVTDTQILEAMDWLFRYQKQVVEPSGACALAALLCGEVQPVGQRVGVILCGGNISLERFTDLLQQGTIE
tara:strand:+ start:1091 stop:2056 length:966 start_codon:yes stop_codon:yes gene_type:complete